LKLGIRGKLFLVSLGLISISILAGYSSMRSALAVELGSRERDRAAERSLLVARALGAAAGERAWQTLVRDLSHTLSARVLVVAKDHSLLADSGGDPEEARELASRVESDLLLSGRAQRSSAVESAGILRVASALERGSGERCVVWLSYPLTRLDQAVSALVRPLTLALLLALAVAVAMSSLAAELASRTARGLTEVARRMARGDLSVRAGLSGGDEFGELGRTLDQLAQSLSASLDELREERDRLGGILSGMQEGVLLLDADRRIALVNPALREMLLLGADAVGKTLLEAIRHADLQTLLDQARDAVEPATREIEIGGIKPRRTLVRVAHVPGGEGQLFAVFVDVTEVRRLESMRRDFVANVSHELRTPVTAIRSAAETLQSGLPEDRAVLQQFLGIIERNAGRLQDLVEDVLDLSHIESQKLRLHMEAIDLRGIYSQVVSLFRERADKKRILLVSDVGLELPRVHGDRRALEHVLTNLIDNAIKYCGPAARVQLSASSSGDSVSLLVADTGPGIEERHLPRLFERFYRVDAGRSRELGGTGLGHAIVKKLVEAKGGSVQVTSATGVGTTFSVTLKRAEAELARAVA
jgi:two-component system phosphate regulon sensor histidine kinase PhoR